MRETAIVVCPGRGTYNAAELGYLARHHSARAEFVSQLDAIRAEAGQQPISDLDGAANFSPNRHMTGDNASLLIYACALADFQAIDHDRFEIVAVTGNSMGWYLTLGCAGALDILAAARLVNNMGKLMHDAGVGGQVVYPIVDEDWRPDQDKQQIVERVFKKAGKTTGVEVYTSIALGGLIVFAANDKGLAFLSEELPKLDRYPMRLNQHAAFHSPLLDHIVPTARTRNPKKNFGDAALPMIDGKGRIWAPSAYDINELYQYTLGEQISQPYNFSKAIEVSVKEFAPDRVIVLGPGTTLGAPTAQSLIQLGWRGLTGKADFIARQKVDPFVLSMGIDEQRAIVVRQDR